jgi:hypothetical protein
MTKEGIYSDFQLYGYWKSCSRLGAIRVALAARGIAYRNDTA